jgi:cytoskeletal protein RodZ
MPDEPSRRNESFDPYHEWLGIPASEQPPHHYRLLGIVLFEDNSKVIENAADQRMAHVRTYQLGKYSDLSQKLLNELATAKICLLNPEKKAVYDQQLRKETKVSLSEAIPAEPDVELDPLADLAEMTRSAPISDSHKPTQQSLHRPVASASVSVPATGPARRRKKGQISPHGSVLRFIGLAVAGVLGLGTAWLLNSYFNSGNPTSKNTAEAEHNQPARKSEEVKVLVDKRAQSAASRSPGPTKPSGQTGPPMLERSSDPSLSTVSTKPVIEVKPSVDTPATVEKPPIEKTLSQEEEELKAASEAAKSTEDHQAVAEKGLRLADRAIVEGNADLAKTAVRKSLTAARKADDVALTKRATQLLMQLQNPLSESVKDEARKRRGLEQHFAQAAEESIPASVVPLKAMVMGLTERANGEYSYATAIAFTRRDSPHVIKGTLYPADGTSDGTITIGPGVLVQDGTIDLRRSGKLVVEGSPAKPAVLRNVCVVQDLSASMTAENAVFDQCTFTKGGGWFVTSYSSQWTLEKCFLYQCRFPLLSEQDYGVRFRNCTFASMQFPEFQANRPNTGDFDHMQKLRKDWRIMEDLNFINCQIPPTVFWCSVRSNFFRCRFVPGEAFESPQPAECVAYVTDTIGESPRKVFSDPPPKKATMAIRQAPARFDVFSLQTLPIRQIRNDEVVRRYLKPGG